MKKVIKWLGLMVFILLLSACSTKQQTTIFEKTSGQYQGEIQVIHTGDKVDKLDMDIITVFPDNDLIDEASMQEVLNSIMNYAIEVKGMTFAGEIKENKLIFHIVIDTHEIDWNAFNGTQFNTILNLPDVQKEQLLNFDKVKANLNAMGYKEQ